MYPVSNAFLTAVKDKTRKDEAVTAFVERLREMDSVSDEFDEDLWYGMVDTITVHKDGSAAVWFKGGAEINVK